MFRESVVVSTSRVERPMKKMNTGPIKMRPLLSPETSGSLHTVGWHVTPEKLRPLVESVVKLKVRSGEKPVRCVKGYYGSKF